MQRRRLLPTVFDEDDAPSDRPAIRGQEAGFIDRILACKRNTLGSGAGRVRDGISRGFSSSVVPRERFPILDDYLVSILGRAFPAVLRSAD